MNEPVILHLVASLSLMGGTAAKILSLIQNTNFQHIVYYPKAKSNDKYLKYWEKESNCILIEGLTRKNYIKDAINVRHIIKKFQPNIIHVYFPPETITASITKYLSPNIKLVRSFEGNVAQGPIKRFIIKLALNNFDNLIYISNYVRKFYKGKIPKSLQNKGKVIYNAAARETPLNHPIKHKAEAKEIVTISGLNHSKNLFTLIEAINILIKNNINVHLNILGDGPLKEALINKINEHNLSNHISLLGFSDKVIQYLDSSSIYVHPASNEGFGIAVIEAMQRYCAVIVSNAGALPEIVTNNVNGLIAEVFDSNDWAKKIEFLLNHQELIDRLGTNAYSTANQNFSTNKYVDEHQKLYLYILN